MAADILLDGEDVKVEGNLSGGDASFNIVQTGVMSTHILTSHTSFVIVSDSVLLTRKDETKPWPSMSSDMDGVALTHTDKDELVINQGGGYKGGVTIEGTVNTQELKANRLSGTFLVQDKPFLGRPGIHVVADKLRLIRKDEAKPYPHVSADMDGVALAVTDKDKLVINEGGGYKQGVQIEGNVSLDQISGDVDLAGGLTVKAPPRFIPIPIGQPQPFPKRLEISNTSIKYVYAPPRFPVAGQPDAGLAIDLIEEIQRLRQQVDFLYTKLNMQKPAPEPLK